MNIIKTFARNKGINNEKFANENKNEFWLVANLIGF